MIIMELNTEELEVVMFRLGGALEDKTEVMEGIGEFLRQATIDRILAGTQPDGQPFAPRSQTTIDIYAAQGQTYGQPLNRKGDMRDGIDYEASKDSVVFGSSAIQAAVMQFGAEQGSFGAQTGRTRPSEKRPKSQDYFTTLPWGDIPARPFIGLSESDEVSIIELISEYLEEAARD
ncbi:MULTISPECIES: phage virion morphogenesis protein [unclassified Yoonia]|uniref:phage virion morphogenesis protein n=1 Tax=unclassified Yoonia TaxID=2629118 RepID=UPI002AFEA4B2|nr:MULTISPECIES: phage virion morphogenesis protein [unclassified Yoonia]